MKCTKCIHAGDHTKFWHSFVNITLLLKEFRSLVYFLIVKPLLGGAKLLLQRVRATLNILYNLKDAPLYKVMQTEKKL